METQLQLSQEEIDNARTHLCVVQAGGVRLIGMCYDSGPPSILYDVLMINTLMVGPGMMQTIIADLDFSMGPVKKYHVGVIEGHYYTRDLNEHGSTRAAVEYLASCKAERREPKRRQDSNLVIPVPGVPKLKPNL